MNYAQRIMAQWQGALADRRFAQSFLLNFLFCLSLYFIVIHWLVINRTRGGAVINDPVQALFPPADFSLYIGFFTYTSTIAFLLYIVQFPRLLHRAFQSFTAVFVIRAMCIFLLPLAPPANFIPLLDPFSDFVAHEGQIYNDLFFSGHIADLTIFYLTTNHIRLRRWIGFSIVLVGTMMVIQRVHYSADVFCAMIMAYACHKVFVVESALWITEEKPSRVLADS
ncbi:MAG: phosphatase PAP2-related protein [Chitinophagales bacterium]